MNIREEAKYVAVICNLIHFLVQDGGEVPENILALQRQAAAGVVNENLIDPNEPMEEMTAGLLQKFIDHKEFD